MADISLMLSDAYLMLEEAWCMLELNLPGNRICSPKIHQGTMSLGLNVCC